MAEPEVHAAPHFDAGFIKQKVGPLPLYVWLIAGVAIWYFFNRAQNASTAPGAESAVDAGLDPATGESYASELGAATQQLSDDQTGQTGIAGGFASDKAWATAAVNYLVGLGINATEASNAVNNYIGNLALTSQEQADVNLAIQGIGAPPTVHTTTGGTTTTPGGTGSGTGGKPPAPGGLAATDLKTTSTRLSWTAAPGATSYRVRLWGAGKPVQDKTSADTGEYFGSLKSGAKYSAHVAAINAAGMGPYGTTISFTTPKVITSKTTAPPKGK